MQTNFTLAQLADPDVAESEKILRACVHWGFCIATCPTYVLDGNELDSPRGRIYPSGVHYMHLVDHARTHIEETYRRPLGERLMRWLLANVMPYPRRFQFAIHAALFAKPLAPLAQAVGFKRLAAMLQLSPSRRPHAPRPAQTFPATAASGR